MGWKSAFLWVAAFVHLYCVLWTILENCLIKPSPFKLPRWKEQFLMVFVEPPAEFILNKDKYFIHCQCAANGHRINWYTFLTMNYLYLCRADSRLAPSQWETPLQSNAVSHWLGTSLESALLCMCVFVGVWQKHVIFVLTMVASQASISCFMQNPANLYYIITVLKYHSNSASGCWLLIVNQWLAICYVSSKIALFGLEISCFILVFMVLL